MYLFDSKDHDRRMLDLSKPVTIYSCGYTPIERIHLGNARPFFVADLLKKTVLAVGKEAVLVQGISDADRRVDGAASAADRAREQFVSYRVNGYLADSSLIGIGPADYQPVASECADAIVDLLIKLQEQGLVREEGAGLRLTLTDTQKSMDLRSLDPDGRIRSMMCFTGQQWDLRQEPLLWDRRSASGWRSPWGAGHPDENFICAALAHCSVGTPVSVHVGSVDLYSHHEIEMAAGTFAYGVKYAELWIHSGSVQVDGQRMANSVGNVVSVHEAVSQYGADALRLLYLGTPYAEPLNASSAQLRVAQRRAGKLRSVFESASEMAEETGLLDAVTEALASDLNTEEALRLLETAGHGNVGRSELREASQALGLRWART